MDENGKEINKEYIPNPKADDDKKKKKEEVKKEAVVEEEPIVELDTSNMEEFK